MSTVQAQGSAPVNGKHNVAGVKIGSEEVFQQQMRQELIQRFYTAYQSNNRPLMESLLGMDFRFTSPYDDSIDRYDYFRLVWADTTKITRVDIVKILLEKDLAFVQYEYEHRDGAKYRNMDSIRFQGNHIVAVEVFFGIHS